MYTVPAKVSVRTKTLVSAFEGGQVNSLNKEEVEEPKPQHPELIRDELAEPGTARKLLLAFESKRQEAQNFTPSGPKSPILTARLSLDRFTSFEDKQTNGLLNGNGEVASTAEETVTIRVERTEVVADKTSNSGDPQVQVEKKVIEITKEIATNGDQKTVQIEATAVSATIEHTNVENTVQEVVKQKIVDEIENRVEERVETIVQEAIHDRVEEKIEEGVKNVASVTASTAASHTGIEIEVSVTKEVKHDTSVNERIEERVEETIKETVKEIVEDKIEERIEEKVREKVEEKVEDKVKEKVQEKVVEKIEEAVAANDTTATVSISVTKTSAASSAEVKVELEAKKPKIALIVSAVKPDGGIDAALRYAAMTVLEEQGHNVLYTDAHKVPRSETGGPDFASERQKLLKSDLIILHFRPILNSPPAALKLWLEGTLVQSDGKFIDKALLKGKKAIVLVTTDADKVPDERLLSLPFLSAVQDDILKAISMDVISPFIIFGVGESLDETTQKGHVDAWTNRIASAFL